MPRYQTGFLLGPLIGLALTGFDFQLTCAVSAGIFAILTVLQLRALPQRTAPDVDGGRKTVLTDWRSVVANRSFVLFSVAMIGSYVLSFRSISRCHSRSAGSRAAASREPGGDELGLWPSGTLGRPYRA